MRPCASGNVAMRAFNSPPNLTKTAEDRKILRSGPMFFGWGAVVAECIKRVRITAIERRQGDDGRYSSPSFFAHTGDTAAYEDIGACEQKEATETSTETGRKECEMRRNAEAKQKRPARRSAVGLARTRKALPTAGAVLQGPPHFDRTWLRAGIAAHSCVYTYLKSPWCDRHPRKRPWRATVSETACTVMLGEPRFRRLAGITYHYHAASHRSSKGRRTKNTPSVVDAGTCTMRERDADHTCRQEGAQQCQRRLKVDLLNHGKHTSYPKTAAITQHPG
ncbi:hypothetical protein HPB51_016743 [Rhipicephalus microplus]|uniref:Uncharacterized protein n=1 Tax=Rhipicephalus microplus TaxID=6941 RepID=A0A9J6DAW1_RHIMP|nr:hypothetical protein HPB51_016743 [Rhipicephalus microplus]